MSVVDYRVEGDVALLCVSNPPVNALSLSVRQGLMRSIGLALDDPSVKALVIMGDGKGFVAGGDIAELGNGKSAQPPRLRDIQRTIEASPKPIVAAIHGAALGGGLELALACHARVAVASAKLGLQEIKLGLCPGAGGTVRLTRLVGPKVALDHILSGEHAPAATALRLGILDGLVEDLRTGAIAYAQRLSANVPPRPALLRTDRLSNIDPNLFASRRAQIAKRAHGDLAPAKIIDCVEAACTHPPDKALAYERRVFNQLLGGDQQRALAHAFFAERQAGKIPDLPAGVTPLMIARVGIVGAGLMGGGVAMALANAGMQVTLLDSDPNATVRTRSAIEKHYAAAVRRGAMASRDAEAALGRIASAMSYEQFTDVDLALEAVYEDLKVKCEVLTALDRVTPPHAILASNTSSLDIDEIARATRRPDKVVGMHFFSPAHVMRLQENVRGALTSWETIASVTALAARIGKISVLAGNCEGFIANRMLQFYMSEAEFLLEEGAPIELVDGVAEAFGMPMGPLAVLDLAGLDTTVRVRARRRARGSGDETASTIVSRLVEAGRLGQKSGKGFYRYKGRSRAPDPEAAAIIEDVARSSGLKKQVHSDEEIAFRLFHPIVNEAAKILESGVALRASDIDVVWIHGYGFPAYRGGPMFWSEQAGLGRVLETVRALGPRRDQRWRPSPLLERLAASKEGWASAARTAHA